VGVDKGSPRRKLPIVQSLTHGSSVLFDLFNFNY
jgi:hypothetical protein